MDSRPASIGVLAIVCVVASAAVLAQSGYAITSPDSSPVPERSFGLQGENHTVDSRISVTPGTEISVDVAAPDEVYRVYLYNGDQQIVDRQRGEGDGSYTFDLTGYEPGSYAITTHSRETDQHEAVMPVLVEGYDVAVEGPSSVRDEESFDVTITVSDGAASDAPPSVSAVLASDDEEYTVAADGGDGEYTASVAASDLEASEYTVYGVVQGPDEAFDQDELLGLAEGGTVTVGGTAETDGTANGTASQSSTDGEGSTAESDASPAAGETATADQGGAITPDDVETTVGATDASGPGFGPTHLVVAFGAVLAVILVRRNGEV